MDKKNYKDMWVHVELEEGRIAPVSLELCCEIRKLCDKAGDALEAVVAGEVAKAELDKLKDCGVDKLSKIYSNS